MTTGRRANGATVESAPQSRKKPSKAGTTARAASRKVTRPRAKSASTARSTPAHKVDAGAIAARLTQAIPEPRCELQFETPFQLLIATILSAQSTDKAVNAVTPGLFARYPTPLALAEADPAEVETLIKRTGFFRAKTKSIRGAAQKLVDAFDGEVPRTLEALMLLPGVARKTSNVVLGTAFGIASGFVVDTHVARVAQRLSLTPESDATKIERDLCQLFPQERWVDLGHRLLLHGRYTCLAKAPKCEVCPLHELCPSRTTTHVEGDLEARSSWEAERVRSGMAAAAKP